MQTSDSFGCFFVLRLILFTWKPAVRTVSNFLQSQSNTGAGNIVLLLPEAASGVLSSVVSILVLVLGSPMSNCGQDIDGR